MITGSKLINRPLEEVLDRLKLAMSGGNYEIIEATSNSIKFRHGTYLTQSAPTLPKQGKIVLYETQDGVKATYAIKPTQFTQFWLMLIGIVFCWLIYPPILTYRTLIYHPRRLMENLLQGI